MEQIVNSAADVVLVRMPYAFSSPSLSLGMLKAELEAAEIPCRAEYASERFISFLGADCYPGIEKLVNLVVMGWEILFARAAGISPAISPESLLEEAAAELAGSGQPQADGMAELRRIWPWLSGRAEAFIDEEARRIAALRPKVVGCALMVQERNSSVALLCRLKELLPGVVTMLGGGACAGERGREYLRVFPAVDYVFSGEAEGVFADICRCLCSGEREEMEKRHPELLSRRTPGDVPPPVRMAEDLDASPIPDYGDFFAQRTQRAAMKHYLVLESSRGCWWGERNRCRFCGLHFSQEARVFREKSPRRFWEEVRDVTGRYGCYDILLSDCVLGKAFVAALPEEAEGELRKVSLMAECKSTLGRQEIRRLKHNGFDALQPGIESLSDEILTLMRKGAAVIDHLSFLKSARIFGVHAVWNILCGIPGEKREWYEEMLRLMGRLHHLEPPNAVCPMLLAKDSVFAEEPEKYGLHRILLRACELAKDPDDRDFTRKTSHYYTSPDLPADAGMVALLREEVLLWRHDFLAGAHLLRACTEDSTIVRDARNLQDVRVHRLVGVKKALYDMADEVIGEKEAYGRLEGTYTGEELGQAIRELSEEHLMYRGTGRLLALATPRDCASYRNRYRTDGKTVRAQILPIAPGAAGKNKGGKA